MTSACSECTVGWRKIVLLPGVGHAASQATEMARRILHRVRGTAAQDLQASALLVQFYGIQT